MPDPSIDFKSDLLPHLVRRVIITYRCRRCGLAAAKCPVGAIKQDFWGRFYISRECIGCGLCVKLCPAKAII